MSDEYADTGDENDYQTHREIGENMILELSIANAFDIIGESMKIIGAALELSGRQDANLVAILRIIDERIKRIEYLLETKEPK